VRRPTADIEIRVLHTITRTLSARNGFLRRGAATGRRCDREHDFNHIDFDVSEFDQRAGTPGLHTVRGSVKAEPRATLLPPDLFQRFVDDAFRRRPRPGPKR
jgi:hypothetical protein